MSAMRDDFGPALARDHDEETRAGRYLYRSAWQAMESGVSAQTWQDTLAPQWALDAVPQARVTHLIAYLWRT